MSPERTNDFYAVIEREGLIRPDYLRGYSPLEVIIEEHPDSDEPDWHIYLLKTRAKGVEAKAERFSQITKPDWYSVFWNSTKTLVVLRNNVIAIPTEEVWQSPEYADMQNKAKEIGVSEQYLDFNENFQNYRLWVAKVETKS